MRQRLVTENVIDIAVDINESLRVADGVIPMEVETLEETPEIEEAEVGKYYAEEDYVLTPDLEKDEWIKSYPICISYDGHLYIIKNGVWSKIIEINEAPTENDPYVRIKDKWLKLVAGDGIELEITTSDTLIIKLES